jgi:hypothetical protein
MSTVRANTYLDASGGSAAQLYGVASPPNSMGFRNRILNGDCRIDQRNAGASVTQTTSVVYTVDRWSCYGSAASKFTVQRNAGSVTPPTGFTNYLGATSSSAYSVGASEFFFIQQVIEGFNVADLGWGTASAQSVTLSFWVRSSLTGTFGGTISNGATNRVYPFTFTISSANTWEQKTLTVSGDTTGTWSADNSGGIVVNFNMGAGASVSGTAGAWSGSTLRAPTGATSVVGTNGATFYITGVQLEAGTVASPFERRDYGRELMMCQRYYCKTFNQSVVPASNAGQAGGFVVPAPANTAGDRGYLVTWRFPVSMRAAPTVTTFNPSAAGSGWFTSSGGSVAASTANAGTDAVMITHTGAATANQNAVIHATASIEL